MSDVNFCEQRRLMQINNTPPTRFNPTNPYVTGGFTKFQLDMRRKVETLKYSSNKSSTQTNNLTKKEKFALLVRGGLSRTQAVIQSNVIDCSLDQLIPTLTTASGVPGPIMYLYEDGTVPLYNYSDFNSRSYSTSDYADQIPWKFVIQPNVLVYDNGTSNVYYLIINNTINSPSIIYNITMPVGIAVAGVVPRLYSPPLDFSGNAKIKLSNVTLSIYYGDNIVKTVTPSTDLTGFVMDVTLPTSGSGTSSSLAFSATVFLGNLVFSGIQLYTAATYVYKFVLSVNVTATPIDNGLIQYATLVSNITNSNNVSTGPITINNAITEVYVGPSINSVV